MHFKLTSLNVSSLDLKTTLKPFILPYLTFENGFYFFQGPYSINTHFSLWTFIFDLFASIYDLILKLIWPVKIGNEQEWRQAYIDKLKLSENATVLDIGCGTGNSFGLLPQSIDYFGIDQSVNMLTQFVSKLNHLPVKQSQRLFLAKAEEMPFTSQIFNSVLMIGSLQYAKTPQDWINEVLRLLKPKGSLIIVDECSKLSKMLHCLGIHLKSTDNLDQASQLINTLFPYDHALQIELIANSHFFCIWTNDFNHPDGFFE